MKIGLLSDTHGWLDPKLLDFMIADTRKRKLKKIELDVWEFNDSAIEFYQATGFKETRRWMEYEVE